mmetsp:Transcript_34611/g.83542  ORF Transcript_34611/g.83542 Transcript_34611/m.83542 type:complete len:337 (-) Transcript_34611:639-1649(-)
MSPTTPHQTVLLSAAGDQPRMDKHCHYQPAPTPSRYTLRATPRKFDVRGHRPLGSLKLQRTLVSFPHRASRRAQLFPRVHGDTDLQLLFCEKIIRHADVHRGIDLCCVDFALLNHERIQLFPCQNILDGPRWQPGHLSNVAGRHLLRPESRDNVRQHSIDTDLASNVCCPVGSRDLGVSELECHYYGPNHSWGQRDNSHFRHKEEQLPLPHARNQPQLATPQCQCAVFLGPLSFLLQHRVSVEQVNWLTRGLQRLLYGHRDDAPKLVISAESVVVKHRSEHTLAWIVDHEIKPVLVAELWIQAPCDRGRREGLIRKVHNHIRVTGAPEVGCVQIRG